MSNVSKSFEHQIIVLPGDIDNMGHVNNVVYVRWAQEVAAAHWEHVAAPDLRLKYAWVVLRHEIDYKIPALPNDTVRGITWVGDYNGAKFDRYVKLMKGDKMLAEAKTTWCLLDGKSLRPTRIPQEIIALL